MYNQITIVQILHKNRFILTIKNINLIVQYNNQKYHKTNIWILLDSQGKINRKIKKIKKINLWLNHKKKHN